MSDIWEQYALLLWLYKPRDWLFRARKFLVFREYGAKKSEVPPFRRISLWDGWLSIKGIKGGETPSPESAWKKV